MSETKSRLFYVSAIDGPRYTFLLGPFKTHEEALAAVETARTKACEVDPKAWFYAFGTARAPEGYDKPGILETAT